MRTTPIVGVVLCFGVAFTLISGAGIGSAVFGQSAVGADTAETLEDIGNKSALDSDDPPTKADVAGDNEPSVVGFALSGGEFLTSVFVSVALLPVTLMKLGFPEYFALPVGSIAQFVAAVGIFQFVTGRELL